MECIMSISRELKSKEMHLLLLHTDVCVCVVSIAMSLILSLLSAFCECMMLDKLTLEIRCDATSSAWAISCVILIVIAAATAFHLVSHLYIFLMNF